MEEALGTSKGPTEVLELRNFKVSATFNSGVKYFRGFPPFFFVRAKDHGHSGRGKEKSRRVKNDLVTRAVMLK